MLANAFPAILALILIAGNPVRAEWALTGGPQGGIEIKAFAQSGGYLFAALQDGMLFRTGNQGRSWTYIHTDLPKVTLESLVAIESDLLVGTRSGVFKSSDGGTTWKRVKSDSGNSVVQAFAVRGGSLFAVGNGVFRSADKGESWTRVAFWSEDSLALSIAVNDSEIFVADNRGSLRRSRDDGDSWTRLKPVPENNPVYDKPITIKGRAFFSGIGYGVVFHSLDFGKTWIRTDNGTPSSVFKKYDSIGDKLIVGEANEVTLSSDNGATWVHADNGIMGTDFSALIEISGVLFAGNAGGVFRSLDTGATWSRISAGYDNNFVKTLVAYGNALYAGTGRGKVTRSNDSGDNWSVLAEGLASVPAILPLGDTLFITTESIGVRRSFDKGGTWDSANTGLRYPDRTYIFARSLASKGPYLFTGMAVFGVHRSADYGRSWTQVNQGMSYAPTVECMFAHGPYLFAGTDRSGVFRSSDYGDHWIAVNAGLPSRDSQYGSVRSSAVIGDDLFVATGSGIFRSADDGANWFPINGFAPPGEDLSTHFALSLVSSGNQLFASTYLGVFHSSDAGGTWNRSNSGLENASIGPLAVMGDYLFAGDGSDRGGVWRRPLSEMAGPDSVPVSRAAPFLSGFGKPGGLLRSGGQIEFNLGQASYVRLNAYDARGIKRAALMDGMSAPGRHLARFDGSGLSPGLYFLRLEAGGRSSAIRVILER